MNKNLLHEQEYKDDQWVYTACAKQLAATLMTQEDCIIKFYDWTGGSNISHHSPINDTLWRVPVVCTQWSVYVLYYVRDYGNPFVTK